MLRQRLVRRLLLQKDNLDNGEIASGGVDLFLASVKRTIGKNVKIGVHSWDEDGSQATDYPRESKEHQKYKEAEDFYYFTINSATAEGIHYMTEEEMNKYKALNRLSEI